MPYDSIVVFLVAVFFAGAVVVARDRLAAAFFAGAFFAAALVPGAFAGAVVPGALAAVAETRGRRVGAAVAEVSFFRATRSVVDVGFPPGVLAALAPVARFVAAATFFVAAFRFSGPPWGPPVALLVPPVDLAAIVPPRGSALPAVADGTGADRPARALDPPGATVFPRPRPPNAGSFGGRDPRVRRPLLHRPRHPPPATVGGDDWTRKRCGDRLCR
ncbi:hypothetical protein Q3W71_25275 [Micromonospora sp. C28SCA-DRY-2]|uniref:hypothetical protein n=1 Tax=Micromonospora sp. C28SCA-DRY-2 TaxID=3059522 RepID=UPI0026762737|nr:hypothetical protein [Micromonospora sp. C28SCA-DRY-2]MDO3704983.1 hypothetical protein [Micromonospora sp. C28SCA-DRY-2]